MYEYALHRMRSGQERIDMAVDFGTNGHEALARLRTGSRVDLVITDLYMPVMDGFALLEQIRADPALMETPVVVISAGGQDARDRAAELGVDVFLRKPVQFIDVIQTVQMLLRIAP
jgi:CheY-like chemotaxis protein